MTLVASDLDMHVDSGGGLRHPPGSKFRVEDFTLSSFVTTGWGSITNTGSGVTWTEEHNTVLVATNNDGFVDEYSLDDLSTRIRRITLPEANFDDIEGCCWLGNNELAICSEDPTSGSGANYYIRIYDYIIGESDAVWNPKQILTLDALGPTFNGGAEGVAYDKQNEIFWCVGETPQRIYRAVRPVNRTTNYSYLDPELVVTQPIPSPASIAADFAGLDFHAPSGTLIIASHLDENLKQIDPDTGSVLSTFTFPATAGDLEGFGFVTNLNEAIATFEGPGYYRMTA